MENEIKIKTEFDLNLKTEWEELEKKSNINLFQTFKWQKYWYEKCEIIQKKLLYYFTEK